MTTCVGWETEHIKVVWTHAQQTSLLIIALFHAFIINIHGSTQIHDTPALPVYFVTQRDTFTTSCGLPPGRVCLETKTIRRMSFTWTPINIPEQIREEDKDF